MTDDGRVREFVTAFETLRAEVEKVIVGHREIINHVLIGMFAGGHVLLEGVPGLGKTLLVKTLSESLELSFSRVQFTPDLMPADIIGTNIIVEDADGRKHFQFQQGPLFAHVVLADEINRATPKTQSALLEGMQEASVTVGGVSRPLPAPFFVLATQNPIEMEGTYPLPEAQLDRFLLRMAVGYPARDDEWQMLADRAERRVDEIQLTPVVDRGTLVEMQTAIEQVYVSEPVGLYMVDVVAATRNAPSIQVGASPRGSLALLKLSRCRAALDGRDFVTPEDVKAVAVPALAHRLMLRPELWVQRVSPEDIVRERLDTVPTPTAEDLEPLRA